MDTDPILSSNPQQMPPMPDHAEAAAAGPLLSSEFKVSLSICASLFALSFFGFITSGLLYYLWFVAAGLGLAISAAFVVIGIVDLVIGKGGRRIGEGFLLAVIICVVGAGSCAANLSLGVGGSFN
jgi:hypothetical protein